MNTANLDEIAAVLAEERQLRRELAAARNQNLQLQRELDAAREAAAYAERIARQWERVCFELCEASAARGLAMIDRRSN
jgi:hypothetical protein